MGSISEAKTLGEIGSILVLLSVIPLAGSALAIIGLILTLIAVKYISDALKDRSIFSNILVAIVLAIIGVAVGGVVVLGTLLRYVGLRRLAVGSTAHPAHIGGLIAGIIIALVIVWIMFIVAAYFQRKSYEIIATRLNVSTFRTAALVYLIGAALVIIAVGFVLLFVAQILFVVAFFSIKADETPHVTMPPAGPSTQAGGSTQTAAPSTQTGRFCAKCGASLPSDVIYCPSCGASQSA